MRAWTLARCSIPFALRSARATRRPRSSTNWRKQGGVCLVAHLHRIAAGTAGPPVAQPADGATYAAKIHKAEAIIDWQAAAVNVDRQVRAFDPAPGASTLLAGERVKLWRVHPAQFVAPSAVPGTVLATEGDTIVVACGDGALGIAELQPAGGRRMSAAAFVTGRRLAPGARFGTDAP